MNDREILAEKAKGTTHIETLASTKAYNLRKDKNGMGYSVFLSDGWSPIAAVSGCVRSLADIQRIVDLEDENEELKRKLEALKPKPTCVNCDEPQVINGKCECCSWLKEEGKYE